MIDETAIGERYRALVGELDERRRRLWAAAAARTKGVVPEGAHVMHCEIVSGQHRIRDAQADRVVVIETLGVHR